MTKDWTSNLDATDEPLYLALVRALAEGIESGALRPGDRLPTHRELADHLGVAVGTVTRAYGLAEQRGLLHGDGRRGTFVGEMRRRASALTGLLIPTSSVIDLSANHPHPGEDPDLSSALRRLARRPEAQQLLQYPTPFSPLHHREAGARWIESLGMSVRPESVIVTAGAQNALMVILSTIARRGDVVVAEEYAYPGIKAIAEVLGLRLLGIPMDEDGLLPDALDEVCRRHGPRALYTSPTLQNPTNVLVPEARRREIVAVARKHGLRIIEDEINRALVTDPPSFFHALAPELGFLVASVSKAVAGGLRVAFVVPPDEAAAPLLDTLHASMLVVSPLPVEILAGWIADGTAAATVARRRRQAVRRSRRVVAALGSHAVKVEPTSYFAWLPLPDGWSAAGFTAEVLRGGVAVSPAEVFAVNPASAMPAVRICQVAAENLERLDRALEVIRAVLDGTSRPDSRII
jgi:DNA-binding transcriptional MocR family regulator